MDETAITRYISETFEDVHVHTQIPSGNTFYFYDPDRMFPFATLMMNDENDAYSNLERPSVFRLNIGSGKATFRAMFGDRPFRDADDPESAEGYDFTALDRFMPHPVYGRMYWVSVLNPSAETFENTVKPLLEEAYKATVAKVAKHAPRA